ncbi:glycosyl hydrolase family 8 [Cytophagaceae bacterium ABcell3]|nr:glycosyl hydrolase family 8 [Cytophagaceae bacterium ABcell3]
MDFYKTSASRFRSFTFIFLLIFLWKGALLHAQVPVDINSGNPNFPFPQFNPYTTDDGHYLGNLATNNAPGVVHAEMEQRIRDAWQIMANRLEYTGEEHAGVQYIIGNIGCPYDCSEGCGYALLAAAEMADKTTFDGLWMRTHDHRMIMHPRYSDCVVPDPDYRYGDNSLMDNVDAAADGDFDIALALLIAYKQWGEFMGVDDACGNPISYKQEALNVIRGLVEVYQSPDIDPTDCRKVSGAIGFDGYVKGGNTWGELTSWATGQEPDCPEFTGPTQHHIDYNAPAYFHAFAHFLETEGDAQDLVWNINQFLRAEASSEWLDGQMLDNPAALPLAGWVDYEVGDDRPVYTNFMDGEDFRHAWRTILNYVWHGNPNTTWNPNTKEVEPGGNTYERDLGLRLAQFMNNPGEAPWSNPCNSVGGGPELTYNGPSQLKYYYDPNTGDELTTFTLNFLHGTGSPAAVAAQDFDLMGKMYRQCAIEWDVTDPGDNYITSVPVYFHGFFRLLGMLTLSGNHPSPATSVLQANMKVYKDVDRTYAFTDDLVTYTISYRNYASVDAEGVRITEEVPEGYEFVSASDGGSLNGETVVWDVGTVPGFTTDGGVEPTTGEVTVVYRVLPEFSGRICAEAEITCTNGTGWVTNEYPNNITAVMERNCVDIIEKALEIDKKVNYEEVNPGTEVKYEVDFKNASSGGFLDGGRPGVVVAHAQDTDAEVAPEMNLKFRLYHGADEPYIDYGNYRISMFVNDNTYDCVAGEGDCDIGWQLNNEIYEGGDFEALHIFNEPIVPGSDDRGAWNQRIVVQFSEQLATTTPHLSRYFGMGQRIHQGGTEPLRVKWRLNASNYADVNWGDDWSYAPSAGDADDGLFYPITNDWTDINNPDIPVTEWHNEACETPSQFVDNILVEEWDGYTWRRVFGDGPLPGREIENVIVRDVLPEGFTFTGFIDEDGESLGDTAVILGREATYDEATRTITWSIPRLQVRQGGTIRYTAIADFSSGECEREDELQTNTASIEGDNESPTYAHADVNVTCAEVILPPPPSSMTKEADDTIYEIGDNITYTLSYENTDGSIARANLNSLENWTSQSGSEMTVEGGELTSVQNNLGVMTYDYSHGIDGAINASIDFAASAAFGLAFRHTGGAVDNGLYVVFKPNPGAGNVEVRLYDGTDELSTTSLGLPGGSPTNIRVVLSEDRLNLWLGNVTNPSPTWAVSGLPVREGYAGVINGFPDGQDTWGEHTLVNFRTHLDSGFDIIMTDPIPASLEFISASDGATVTDGVIEWPVIPGPVPVGETITRTWTGVVAGCPSSGQIVNNAYTNLMGVPNNSIQAQSIVSCGQDIVCTPPDEAEINASDLVFCTGDSVELTATEVSGALYRWYRDGVALGPGQEDWNSIMADQAGEYTVRIGDGSVTDATCYIESDPVELEENLLPDAPDGIDGTNEVCANTTDIALQIEPIEGAESYTWSVSDDGVITGDSLEALLDIGLEPEYIVTVYATNGCGDGPSDTLIIETIQPLEPMVEIQADETDICAEETITFSIADSLNLGLPSFSWIVNGVEQGTLEEFSTSALEDGDVVQLIATSDLACVTSEEAVSDSIVISVMDPLTPFVSIAATDSVICIGEDVQFTIGDSLYLGNATYSWTVNGVEEEIGDAFSSTTLQDGDTVKLTATSDLGCLTTEEAVSEPIIILVSDNITPQVAIEATSPELLCDGETFTAEVTSVTGGGDNPSFDWHVNGLSTGETGDVFNSSSLANGDKITVVMTSNSSCASEPTATSDTLVVNIGDPVTPEATIVASQTTICDGDEIIFEIDSTIYAGETPSFSWSVNGNEQETSEVFTTSTLEDGDEVTLTMTSSLTCVTDPVAVSAPIAIAVTDPVTPTVNIAATNTTICNGESVTFTLNQGEHLGNASYSWLVNGVEEGTSDELITSILNDGDAIQLIAISDEGCVTTDTATSEVITINVDDSVTPEVEIIATSPDPLCDGETFTAEVSSTSGGGSAPTYEWYINGASSGQTGTTFSSATLDNEDEITVELTSNSTCATQPTASSGAIVVNIGAPVTPIVDIVADETEICAGTDINFSIDDSEYLGSNPVYSWTINGVEAETSDTFSSDILEDGDVVQLIATSDINCVTASDAISNEITITVHPIVVPDISITSDAVDGACEPDEVNFSINTQTNEGPAPHYEWYVNGEAHPNPGTTLQLSNPQNKDQVYVQMTSNALCAEPQIVSSEVITLNFTEPENAEISLTGGQPAYCGDQVVELNAQTPNSNATISWTQERAGTTILTTTGTSFTAPDWEDGDIIFAIVNITGSCIGQPSDQDTFIINLGLSPEIISHNGIISICEGDDLVLVGNSPGTWYENDVQVGDGNEFNTDRAGVYHFTYEPGCGLLHSDTVEVIVEPVPEIIFIRDNQAVSSGEAYIFSPSEEVWVEIDGSYLEPQQTVWSAQPHLNLSDPEEVDGNIITRADAPIGDYWYLVNATIGNCSATDSILVRVLNELTVPNAFTPDGDGINDYWELPGIERYPDAEFVIFNRWGMVVYEHKGSYAGNPWNGRSNKGHLYPVATYYYVIHLNDGSGETLTGHVTLIY